MNEPSSIPVSASFHFPVLNCPTPVAFFLSIIENPADHHTSPASKCVITQLPLGQLHRLTCGQIQLSIFKLSAIQKYPIPCHHSITKEHVVTHVILLCQPFHLQSAHTLLSAHYKLTYSLSFTDIWPTHSKAPSSPSTPHDFLLQQFLGCQYTGYGPHFGSWTDGEPR